MMLLCRHASSAMRSFYDGDGNRAATAVVHRLLPRRPAARVTARLSHRPCCDGKPTWSRQGEGNDANHLVAGRSAGPPSGFWPAGLTSLGLGAIPVGPAVPAAAINIPPTGGNNSGVVAVDKGVDGHAQLDAVSCLRHPFVLWKRAVSGTSRPGTSEASWTVPITTRPITGARRPPSRTPNRRDRSARSQPGLLAPGKSPGPLARPLRRCSVPGSRSRYLPGGRNGISRFGRNPVPCLSFGDDTVGAPCRGSFISPRARLLL